MIYNENNKIIEEIIEKINDGYDDYDIERFLESHEINSSNFDVLIEMAENKILENKLRTYPRQNKLSFIFCTSLLVLFFVLFIIILPSVNIPAIRIPLSIIGAISISLSGFYTFLYYKSWNKDFIEKVGKPKLNLQTYFIISSLPTVLLYFIISWCSTNGSGYDLYKLGISIRAIKSLIH